MGEAGFFRFDQGEIVCSGFFLRLDLSAEALKLIEITTYFDLNLLFFLGLRVVFKLGEKNKNDFLNTTFSKIDYLRKNLYFKKRYFR